jgi:hydroxyethylthiazole kinase
VSPDEIAEFVARADALLVNLGTFDAERREAVIVALEEASDESVAWVLDPVLIDRTATRAAFARTLAGRHPSAVRLNRAELATLAGGDDDDAAAQFALEHLTVVGVSGTVDLVTDGTRRVGVANGDALMARARVTAMGCAASALVAACLAVEDDALAATVAGLVAIGVAGEVAAARASGPGTFAATIIDALYGLDRDTIKARAKVT